MCSPDQTILDTLKKILGNERLVSTEEYLINSLDAHEPM
jgi:hypothetical protein